MEFDEHFYKNTLIRLLRQLNDDSKPLWGEMRPQHMVEHVIGSWRVSNGRANAPLLVHGKDLERNIEFLNSDREFEKFTKSPVIGKKLPPLRKPSLKAAIDQLEDEVNTFFDYHEQHPDAILMHPVFGELDKEGWLRFQEKHLRHHLKQFGLL